VFLPLKDHNPTVRTPVVTLGLIAVNALVWLLEVSQGSQMGLFVARWGAVPYELTHGVDLVGVVDGSGIVHAPSPTPVWITAVSSMFLHGSWMHVIFNMLYLWIFGNNVEDFLGRGRFLLFYLGTGLGGLFGHLLFHASSTVPVVGASGAISGVMGAYIVLFPRARVTCLVFLLFFVTFIELPALFIIGIWVAMQVFSGLGSLSMGEAAGVAYWAHIGGFVAGWAALRFWLARDVVARRKEGAAWRKAAPAGGFFGGRTRAPGTPPPPPPRTGGPAGDPIERFLRGARRPDEGED
jgi:membrane associated rhomboid family serine protease